MNAPGKNHWLYEIDARETIINLELALSKSYVGTKADLENWGPFVINFISAKKQRVRDRILSSFQLVWEHDEQKTLLWIKIMMLPWVV
jgi:hypothetical protein